MKIIEVSVNTFKYGFRAYYSSVEAAIELLPKHPNFSSAFGFMLPQLETQQFNNIDVNRYFDYSKNLKDQMKIVLSNNNCLDFYLTGECVTASEYQHTPEIKEPGKPYQEAKTIKLREWKEQYNKLIFRVSFDYIDIDLGLE